MKEGQEEGEALHVHGDYRNPPYQPPTLTPDQQQQVEENLALMTRKGVYRYEYMDPFERFQELKLLPKDAFSSSLTEEDPRPKSVQPLQYDKPRRLSQLLSVNRCAFTG